MFNRKFIFNNKFKPKEPQLKKYVHIPTKSEEELCNNIESLIGENANESKSKMNYSGDLEIPDEQNNKTEGNSLGFLRNTTLKDKTPSIDLEDTEFDPLKLDDKKYRTKEFIESNNSEENNQKLIFKNLGEEMQKNNLVNKNAHKSVEENTLIPFKQKLENIKHKNESEKFKISDLFTDIKSQIKEEKPTINLENDKINNTENEKSQKFEKPEKFFLQEEIDKTADFKQFSSENSLYDRNILNQAQKTSHKRKDRNLPQEKHDLSVLFSTIPNIYMNLYTENQRKTVEIEHLSNELQKYRNMKNIIKKVSDQQNMYLSTTFRTELGKIHENIMKRVQKSELKNDEFLSLLKKIENLENEKGKFELTEKNNQTGKSEFLSGQISEIHSKIEELAENYKKNVEHSAEKKNSQRKEKTRTKNAVEKINHLKQEIVEMKSNLTNAVSVLENKLVENGEIETLKNEYEFVVRSLQEKIKKKRKKTKREDLKKKAIEKNKKVQKRESKTPSENSDLWSVFQLDD